MGSRGTPGSPDLITIGGTAIKPSLHACNDCRVRTRARQPLTERARITSVGTPRRRLDTWTRNKFLPSMDQLNQTLFALINGPADPAPGMLILSRFLANWVLYIAAASLVIGWLRAGARTRRSLVQVGMATLLALSVNFTIAALWYHPRPFEFGIGNQLIAHAAETSFPSDHATILFAIAFSLLAFGAARIRAWLALVAAVAVAWARVWLGIHWPFDMLGSAVVALGAVWIVALARNTRGVERLTAFLLDDFDRLLDLARIPQGWAHRSGKK